MIRVIAVLSPIEVRAGNDEFRQYTVGTGSSTYRVSAEGARAAAAGPG